MERIILHSDLNNFYASVECMLNPELRDKAVAVCGSREDRHGIVLAKNMKAKKCGVATGEPVWQAVQKCPGLVIVPPRFNEYVHYSELVRKIYYQYTDKIEPFGMDECWLDVTGSTNLFGSGYDIAMKIKEQIKAELGLTVSIGVSFNKVFAKLGSDMKKPDAVTCIERDNFREIVWPLPVSALIYVGRATANRLAKYNIHTIGELAATGTRYLESWFGKNGIMLWQYANGLDNSEVASFGYSPPPKSIGHGITCVSDLLTPREVWKVIFELAQGISHSLRSQGFFAMGVSLTIRNSVLEFQEYQKKLEVPSHSPVEIARCAYSLFRANYKWEYNVRAVTVRAISLIPDSSPCQISLAEDVTKTIKRESVETAMEKIRSRFGKHAVTYGSLIGNLKMPAVRTSMFMKGC